MKGIQGEDGEKAEKQERRGGEEGGGMDGEVQGRERDVIAARMMTAARAVVPGLAGASVAAVTRGYRPMPADGMPVCWVGG